RNCTIKDKVNAIIKTLFVALAATMQLAAAEVYGVNDPLMAEYEGFWTASNGTRGRVTAQIRPIGNNQYDGFILLKRAKATVTAFKLNHSAPENGTLKFEGATAKEAGGDLLARNEVSAELKGGRLTG